MILSLEVRIRCCQCQRRVGSSANQASPGGFGRISRASDARLTSNARSFEPSLPLFPNARRLVHPNDPAFALTSQQLRPQQILRQLPKTMMTQHAIRGLSGATALPRLRTSHASLRGVSRAVAPARALVSRRGRANTVVVKGKSSLSEPTNPRPLPGADTVSPSMECSCPPRHFDDRPKLTTSLPDLPLDTQPRRPTGAASFPPRLFASARVC